MNSNIFPYELYATKPKMQSIPTKERSPNESNLSQTLKNQNKHQNSSSKSKANLVSPGKKIQPGKDKNRGPEIKSQTIGYHVNSAEKRLRFNEPLDTNRSNNNISQNFGDGGYRLKDLCPEDKAKIGELIKRLANEQEDKERLRKHLDETKRSYEEFIDRIKIENQDIMKNSKQLQEKFQYSLSLLKAYQEIANKDPGTNSSGHKKSNSFDGPISQLQVHSSSKKDRRENNIGPSPEKGSTSRRELQLQKRTGESEEKYFKNLLKEEHQRLLNLNQKKSSPVHVNNSKKIPPTKENSGNENHTFNIPVNEKPSTKDHKIRGDVITSKNQRSTIPVNPLTKSNDVLKNLVSADQFSSPLKFQEEKDSKAIDEIAKLKNEIEDLTNSLRNINFGTPKKAIPSTKAFNSPNLSQSSASPKINAQLPHRAPLIKPVQSPIKIEDTRLVNQIPKDFSTITKTQESPFSQNPFTSPNNTLNLLALANKNKQVLVSKEDDKRGTPSRFLLRPPEPTFQGPSIQEKEKGWPNDFMRSEYTGGDSRNIYSSQERNKERLISTDSSRLSQENLTKNRLILDNYDHDQKYTNKGTNLNQQNILVQQYQRNNPPEPMAKTSSNVRELIPKPTGNHKTDFITDNVVSAKGRDFNEKAKDPIKNLKRKDLTHNLSSSEDDEAELEIVAQKWLAQRKNKIAAMSEEIAAKKKEGKFGEIEYLREPPKKQEASDSMERKPKKAKAKKAKKNKKRGRSGSDSRSRSGSSSERSEGSDESNSESKNSSDEEDSKKNKKKKKEKKKKINKKTKKEKKKVKEEYDQEVYPKFDQRNDKNLEKYNVKEKAKEIPKNINEKKGIYPAIDKLEIVSSEENYDKLRLGEYRFNTKIEDKKPAYAPNKDLPDRKLRTNTDSEKGNLYDITPKTLAGIQGLLNGNIDHMNRSDLEKIRNYFDIKLKAASGPEPKEEESKEKSSKGFKSSEKFMNDSLEYSKSAIEESVKKEVPAAIALGIKSKHNKDENDRVIMDLNYSNFFGTSVGESKRLDHTPISNFHEKIQMSSAYSRKKETTLNNVDDNLSEMSTPKPERIPQRTLFIQPSDSLPSPPDLFSPGRLSIDAEDKRFQMKLLEYEKIRDRVIKIEDNSGVGNNKSLEEAKESKYKKEDEPLSKSYYEESESDKRGSFDINKKKFSPNKDLHREALRKSNAESKPIELRGSSNLYKKNVPSFGGDLSESDLLRSQLTVEAKKEQEEISRILNDPSSSKKKADHFYENNLVDIVDQLEEEEFIKSHSELGSSVKNSLEQRYLIHGSELLDKRGFPASIKGSSIFSPSHSSLLFNSQKVDTDAMRIFDSRNTEDGRGLKNSSQYYSGLDGSVVSMKSQLRLLDKYGKMMDEYNENRLKKN